MGLETRPVHAFIGVPQGWIEAANASRAEMWANHEGHEPDDEYFIKAQNKRWEERTGLPAQESHFTLIVPIHDERKYLTAALGSLMISDIPADVHLNVVFVTNNCSDESPWIVEDFMSSLGKLVDQPLDDEEREKLNDREINFRTQTTVANWTFTHIDTNTAGKANALNIGNRIALQTEDEVAISMDANNFIEPNAISNLFAAAYYSIRRDPDGAALWSGNSQQDMKPVRFREIVESVKKNARDFGVNRESRVSGWLMAWDTRFLEEIGGVPYVATEDYGFGVMVRKNGRTIVQAEDAKIWGYESKRLRERLNQYARADRSRRQLIDQDPSLKQIIDQDGHFMKSFPNRVEFITQSVIKNPKRAPYSLLKFLMWEYAHIKGGRDFKRNRNSSTWKPIASTKK